MGLRRTLAEGRRPELKRLGIGLRWEEAADEGWLRALFASTREDIAAAPWPETVRVRVTADQYGLRRAHYAKHHPGADRLIVIVRGERAGRLLVDRTMVPWRLVDVALEPLHCGIGIGAALVRWLQLEGRRTGIDLHVARDNPRAAAFYARLGFRPSEQGTATHAHMNWPGRQLKIA